MVIVLAQFIFSALLIIVAGIYLTRSADTIADITGLGKLIIGSLLLAGATSLTELFVGLIHVFTCLAIIFCISVAIIGQLYQVERSKRFFEPDAMIIMGTVIVSYFFLYQYTSS